VIVASLDGKVTVFAAGGDTPKILHQSDFKERIAATPALVENQLYIRTATALYAFGVGNRVSGYFWLLVPCPPWYSALSA
jgi:hypothetical protein